MITKYLVGLLGPIMLVLTGGGVAAAADAPPVQCTAEQIIGGTCHTTAPGGSTGGDNGDPGHADPGNPLRAYTQRRFVPACPINTLTNGADVMCTGAATMCDAAGRTGLTAFWVYSRLYDPTKAEAQQDPFRREPGFTCLGGDSPGVPPIVLVAQQVQRDFERFVVVRAHTRIDPAAKTLVNVDTIFSTAENHSLALEPLQLTAGGQTFTVIITVTPERYTWTFGDGSNVLVTNRPGRPLEKDVTHRYEKAGDVQARVDIDWSGTFTINGGEAIPVRGTAMTMGVPTALVVATANSVLVSH